MKRLLTLLPLTLIVLGVFANTPTPARAAASGWHAQGTCAGEIGDVDTTKKGKD